MADPEASSTSSSADRHTREELDAFLNELIERPYDREDIERRIEETFTQQKAVMVLDMSGFSRTTQLRGIVAYLLMIHQMRLLAVPVVEEHGGFLLKAEADNLFCLFETVQEALAASREVMSRLDTANLVLPEDFELYASIGIGYGPILRIGEHEIAGNQVNLAAKLGEDIAELKEILLTPEAQAEVNEAGVSYEERVVAVSGLELKYYFLQDFDTGA